MPEPILKDLLQPGLTLVFCGTAPSRVSAEKQAYYAKPGNRFWPTLYKVGITPRLFQPQEYPELLELGIGLTDLCKHHSGNDNQLPSGSLDPEALRKKILTFKPRMVAFTSITAGSTFLGRPARLGLQEDKVGNTKLFVCCSTSGVNGHWNSQQHVWSELAGLLHSKFIPER